MEHVNPPQGGEQQALHTGTDLERPTPQQEQRHAHLQDGNLDNRTDPSPADGQDQLWPRPPEREDSEPDPPGEERPPDGTPASAIGRTVVNIQFGHHDDAEPIAEPPSAQYIRAGLAAAQREQRQIDDRTAREIAQQFCAGQVDSALGSFIACGAIWNDNDELFQELHADWQQHSPEQQVWAEALRLYCANRESELPVSHWCEDASSQEMASGIQPEIWVGSLSDYNNGLLHGMWIDATQEPEAIQHLITWILRTSPHGRADATKAEEWAIFEHSGFCGYEVSEWSSLDTVSLVARGIAEHGEAYAAWAKYVGDTSGELLDDERFRDHYEGTFDNLEDYVEQILTETNFHEQLEEALLVFPEDLRRNIRVDAQSLAEEWAQGLHVTEGMDGRLHVFTSHT